MSLSLCGMDRDSSSEGVASGVQEGGKETGKGFSLQDYGLLMKVLGSF